MRRPEGISYSFDHRANGYARGEGIGVVVLKRLSDAIRDGDMVRAVIRSTASNQDGRSPGITQPTKEAQVDLIRQAYARASLSPAGTRFFEAHGTGTPVGDPIEAGAISEVFTRYRSKEEPLYVGAVKSNIGHLEGAAGIAALIKAVYVLEQGVIPPNIWFEKPHAKISDGWHLRFPKARVPWPPHDTVRQLSINSFGFGGANGHVVLNDALGFMSQLSYLGNHRTVPRPQISIPKTLAEAGQPIDSPSQNVEGQFLLWTADSPRSNA